jgi:thiosulfate reductase cytochrome b subunit
MIFGSLPHQTLHLFFVTHMELCLSVGRLNIQALMLKEYLKT